MTLTWKCEDAEHGFQKRWKQRAVRAREETITFTGPCEQEAKQLYTNPWKPFKKEVIIGPPSNTG
jgi:hypothetical protein